MKSTPAKIEALAAKIHDENKAYCESIGDFSQLQWRDTNYWYQFGVVKAIIEFRNNPNLSTVEFHSLWANDKVENGWVYGKKFDIEAKTHPDLVSYAELPETQKIKYQMLKDAALSGEKR
jgi:hypothetical protein